MFLLDSLNVLGFSGHYGSNSGYTPPSLPNGTILYPNGIPAVTYPTNGVTFYNPPENVCTFGSPQANFNVIYPSSVYLPQQTFQCHPMVSDFVALFL
ncbi:hypothetical protein AVEN_161953-1 [Araneus ventricosus]|uniref:Uncharacterized protein n=2 Tax=Araneus ventricosus TaxID=182803 RepID=A0A4Y2QMI1_ARAVE|nr:hypothetical protein AVEN_161953-1 [Araneus ventricosus]